MVGPEGAKLLSRNQYLYVYTETIEEWFSGLLIDERDSAKIVIAARQKALDAAKKLTEVSTEAKAGLDVVRAEDEDDEDDDEDEDEDDRKRQRPAHSRRKKHRKWARFGDRGRGRLVSVKV